MGGLRQMAYGQLLTACLILLLACAHQTSADDDELSSYLEGFHERMKALDLNNDGDSYSEGYRERMKAFDLNNDGDSNTKFNFDDFNYKKYDIPDFKVPDFDITEYKEPKYTMPDYTVPDYKVPEYSYTGGRIIFIPVGAIIFLISLCIRMCLCSAKKPVQTATITTIRSAVIVPVEPTTETQPSPDLPPSYTDVQSEDQPPPYSEVSPPDAKISIAMTDNPSAPEATSGSETASANAFNPRPGFLSSQYSYKPMH